MRDIKSRLELELDPVLYPWQLIQGEGGTWLILRQKKTLQTREIKRIRDLLLDKFTWSVAFRQAGGSLYRGNVEFSIYYAGKNEEEMDLVFTEAPGEESSCRQLLKAGKTTMDPAHMKERVTDESMFSSMVLDEIKTSNQHSPDLNGFHICKINIPWQAWLYGEGEEQEPKIEKVHLGQVGLKTILLEVVVKLQAKQDLGLARFEKSNCVLLPKEEVLYTIKEGVVQEVIGVAVNRAFYSSSVDPLTGYLSLRHLKKATVIFINAGNGGEKILTASALSNEQTKMAGLPVPPVPPAFYRCLNRTQDVVKNDLNKVLCKNEYLWVLDYEAEDLNRYQEEAKAVSLIIAPAGTTQGQGAIATRKKPGEKWLKNTEKQTKNQTKTGMLLKIVK